MRNTDFLIRPLELNDIGNAIRLSRAERWNQTEKDWRRLIENSGNICLAAEWADKIIGTITAVNYANRIAWIGMVLVDKDYRGRGVSRALLTSVFNKLESFKSVKLDATPDGQKVYGKFDFKEEYIIARMTLSVMKDLPPVNDDNIILAPIQRENLREIIALDELIFGADRSRLMESLVKENPGKTWLLKRNGRVAGFALGRDGDRFRHIGPVMASTITDARILIAQALKGVGNQPVVADVLCDKVDLLNWLSAIGFIKERHFIRMYKGENAYPGVVANQYLICGPEFG
jgi:GNAT superfamily N-acetyltransferase